MTIFGNHIIGELVEVYNSIGSALSKAIVYPCRGKHFRRRDIFNNTIFHIAYVKELRRV